MSTIKVSEVEEWNGVDLGLVHFPAIWLGFLKRFWQRPTIALLLHRISHIPQCVYILTKALLLFILLPMIDYVELMVGKKEACTCVTYIAKSNNWSMEMSNHTSWSRFVHVYGKWIKIKDSLHESPLLHFEWHEDMAIFDKWWHPCPSFVVHHIWLFS